MKQIRYTFRGGNRDLTKSKHPAEFYYDAQHIRILAIDDQSTGSVINEKGNELVISIPDISITSNVITYGSKTLTFNNNNDLRTQIDNGDVPASSTDQIILGATVTRDSIILFTSDDDGMDCIWELEGILDGDYVLTLRYLRNMALSSNRPIQALFNYENENIEKIYWVDGFNQIRSINLRQDRLIDIPLNTIDFVGNFGLGQPLIDSISTGGSHTAGMVQYAYNLYRLNSSQTKLSPLSELVPLSKGDNLGGGNVNEQVSSTPVVLIPDIDTQYTHIKVYAIRYTSLDVTPSIEIIEEREINNNDSIRVYDDGGNIGSLSLEELIFLGSDPIVPKHITTKDNVMFPVNVNVQNFDMPDEFDARAYSFNSGGTGTIYSNMRLESGNIVGDPYSIYFGGQPYYDIPSTFDSVNILYDVNKYQSDGSTLGGEGKFLKFEIVQKSLTNPEDYRVLKDREIYRFSIKFYNKLGQSSYPKWICDYKMPAGNLEGNYNTLNVTLKPEFYTWLNSFQFDNDNDRPVGYKIMRAVRNSSDRTIMAQGILTPMMFQVKGEEAQNYGQFFNIANRRNFQDNSLKMPSFLTREFEKVPSNLAANANNGVLQETSHLQWLNDNNGGDEGGEIYTVTNSDQKVSQTFQHSKMFQMYSPDVLFDFTGNFPADVTLNPVGLAESTQNGVYAEERYVDTKEEKNGGRTLGGINPKRIDQSQYIEDNNFRLVFDTPNSGGSTTNNARFIGPQGDNSMGFYQYYRQFNSFVNNPDNKSYDIYGTPEVAITGNESRFYNNDTNFNYANSLQSFISDGEDDCDECDPISSINSYGAKSVAIVLNSTQNTTVSRKGLEELHNESSIAANKNGVMMAEIVRDRNFVYLGGIYGGNTTDDKRRTEYAEIGSYKDITDDTIQIDNAGDTYVQNFRFLRIAKTDIEVYDKRQLQISEIVEFTTETVVDLKNRYDISIGSWDSRFQPRYEEYHGYNTVYSQQSNLIKETDQDFNFVPVDTYDTRISATRSKIPNEVIDSWTDILVNENMDLDGKYGPINAVINNNDEIFTLQDEAVAQIVINPNIQIQGSGVDIELGKGSLLYDYKYLTTNSGTINKWGVIASKQGFYYYDALNKGLFKYPEAIKTSLSDFKGFHSYFNNNFVYDDIKVDNPLKRKGAVMGYDNINHDVYITLLQGDKSFTRCYNELQKEFVDLKTYTPSLYVNKGESMFITDPTFSKLYKLYAGEYNKFFEQYVPSYITLQMNPAVNLDTLFHNIFYRSEIYLDDVDQFDKTLTHIHAYNEYQDSGRIPLILGRNTNLRRKFRQWRADIPRDGRDKMRNPWLFLKLELDNTSNYKMILHDIILQYTVYT